MADTRKLKDEALAATGKGNWKKAASVYAKLELLEDDGLWSLKLGECLRKSGENAKAIQALSRAVDNYARKSLLLKAIAVCKIILEIDPKHTQTQQSLASFHATHRECGPTSEGSTAAVAPVRTAAAPPCAREPEPAQAGPEAFTKTAWTPAAHLRAVAAPSRRSPGIGPRLVAAETKPGRLAPLVPMDQESAPTLLQDLDLATLVPGARQSGEIAALNESTAMEIPIDMDFDSLAPSVIKQAPGPRTLARFVLPKTPLLTALSEDQLRMTIDRVQLVQLETDEILFAMGDPGDAIYVVAAGEIAVLVPREVARLREGDFFGEIALLANQPRNATLRATMPSQVLALDRALVHDLVAGSPDLLKILLRFLRERLIATLMQTSAMLAPFSDQERLELTNRFRFLEVARHTRIVEQGQRPSGLFILLAGEAAAVQDGKPVAHLQAGDVFGELSLMSQSNATATVVTLEKSFVLCMPRAELNEVIMTHPQVLEYLASLAEARKGNH